MPPGGHLTTSITGMPFPSAANCLGGDMSEREQALQLEGAVRLCNTCLAPWPGAELECSDARWEIAWHPDTPYHAFAGRRVLVSGEPFEPESMQRRLWRVGEKPIRHFRVSTMRLVEAAPDAELLEVGAGQQLTGRFELCQTHPGESTLTFVTEQGVMFPVANDPVGATVGRRVEVLAYPVRPAVSLVKSPGQYLWITCPCSAGDIREWRGRSHAGFPRDLCVDAESGKLRSRQPSAEPSAAPDPAGQ